MLKLMFAGALVAGFVLAVATGYGYNPLESGDDSSVAAAQDSPAGPVKAASSTDKPVAPAPAVAVAPAAPAPASTALDAAKIAEALQSIAPGTTSSPGAAPAPSTQSITDMLNGLTGGDNKGGQTDFLGALLGGGTKSGPSDPLGGLLGGSKSNQTDLLGGLFGGNNADISSLLGGSSADFMQILRLLGINKGDRNDITLADLQELMRFLGR